MSSTNNNSILFHDEMFPNMPLNEKYIYLKTHKYALLNTVTVFGPFPKAKVSWDISEEQKIATYNQEVTKVLTWIKMKIILNLDALDYKTLHVLIRIATGMLNKCQIPKETQIMFHDNMVDNLQIEQTNIILSQLPF